MTLQEQYKIIASNNILLINKIVVYICSTFNITVEEYIDNIKYYTKGILFEIKNNNNKAAELRLERRKVRDDLEDLERAYCKSPNLNPVGEGKNTGGKPNNEEIRQIQKLELKEKLGALLLESQLLEKTLEGNNELIRKLINLIPRTQYRGILIFTYLHCMSNSEIAMKLCYTIENVNMARIRGLDDIVKIIKECVIIASEVKL